MQKALWTADIKFFKSMKPQASSPKSSPFGRVYTNKIKGDKKGVEKEKKKTKQKTQTCIKLVWQLHCSTGPIVRPIDVVSATTSASK